MRRVQAGIGTLGPKCCNTATVCFPSLYPLSERAGMANNASARHRAFRQLRCDWRP